MNDIREELIQAIQVVAASTGLTVNECIEESLKILEIEKRRYKEHYRENVEKNLFKEW